jgi:hypothetical protein
VLALEASRLARSSVDWHRLVEICGIAKTLLADESAVYDPRDPNDRLLLGVKGTLSEAELMTIRCRLHDGRWSKARRGEMAKPLPVGYVRTEAGGVAEHPDRQVQARLRYVFELFAELRVARYAVNLFARGREKVLMRQDVVANISVARQKSQPQPPEGVGHAASRHTRSYLFHAPPSSPQGRARLALGGRQALRTDFSRRLFVDTKGPGLCRDPLGLV